MRTRLLPTVIALALAGCTTAGGPYPSLSPRAAEAIDPRVAVVRPMNDRPVAPALERELAALVGEARGGQAAFERAAAEAERVASAAGAPQSESWIAAQEALSAAIAARKPTAMALADIDSLAATALQAHGGIAPNDLRAIQSASAEVSGVARAQTDRIAAIQRRLGL
jgi:hypothetical protein